MGCGHLGGAAAPRNRTLSENDHEVPSRHVCGLPLAGGFAGQRGSRLKWLVIAGFLLALANLLGVRHDFEEPAQSTEISSQVMLTVG